MGPSNAGRALRHPQAPATQPIGAHVPIQKSFVKSRYARRIQLLVVIVAASATALHAQTYKALYTYSINSGAYSGIVPDGLMSQGHDGNLYSTIQNNGTAKVGTAFNMTTGGQLNTIYNFCSQKGCLDGSSPAGGVTLGTETCMGRPLLASNITMERCSISRPAGN
jgi:hypothetical protein